MHNPCNGCQERTITCHGSCEKYAAFAEACEKIRKIRASYSILDSPGEEKLRNTRRKLNKYHK